MWSVCSFVRCPLEVGGEGKSSPRPPSELGLEQQQKDEKKKEKSSVRLAAHAHFPLAVSSDGVIYATHRIRNLSVKKKRRIREERRGRKKEQGEKACINGRRRRRANWGITL